MSRSALVVLTALLLACTAFGTVHALPSAASQAGDGSFTMLTIDNPSQNDHSSQSVDVSRAIGLQREAAENRIELYAFEARLADEERADSAVVREELNRIDDRIDELQAAERNLRHNYTQRQIDATTYVYGLARLDARATQLRERLDVVGDRAEERNIDASNVTDQEARLVGYTGPVRERVGATILGQAPAVRVDVKASPNGTALSMIQDGVHVREAFRADERTPGAGTIPSDELYGSFTNELVSDVYEVEPQSTGIRRLGHGLYEIRIQAPRASPYLTITAHVDGDTRGIFAEVQEREIDRLPPREAVVAIENETRLVVNRSFPAGPLRIATYDNTTGQPISTTVKVGGEQFRTDDDGELWTLAPRRYEFPVEAVAPGGNVSVEVRTLQTISVRSST